MLIYFFCIVYNYLFSVGKFHTKWRINTKMGDENDFDIYGDLDGDADKLGGQDDTFADELSLLSPVKVPKLEKIDKSSDAEIKKLQEQLEILQKRLDEEIEKNEKVKTNFSIMLRTARNEIQR